MCQNEHFREIQHGKDRAVRLATYSRGSGRRFRPHRFIKGIFGISLGKPGKRPAYVGRQGIDIGIVRTLQVRKVFLVFRDRNVHVEISYFRGYRFDIFTRLDGVDNGIPISWQRTEILNPLEFRQELIRHPIMKKIIQRQVFGILDDIRFPNRFYELRDHDLDIIRIHEIHPIGHDKELILSGKYIILQTETIFPIGIPDDTISKYQWEQVELEFLNVIFHFGKYSRRARSDSVFPHDFLIKTIRHPIFEQQKPGS
jgi:hypothetical protein